LARAEGLTSLGRTKVESSHVKPKIKLNWPREKV